MKAVLLWLAACALALLLSSSHLLDGWHAWARWVGQAQAAERERLQRQAVRDDIAHVQTTCGPETWWLPRADGGRDCTDKRGRRTGQQLAGANP